MSRFQSGILVLALGLLPGLPAAAQTPRVTPPTDTRDQRVIRQTPEEERLRREVEQQERQEREMRPDLRPDLRPDVRRDPAAPPVPPREEEPCLREHQSEFQVFVCNILGRNLPLFGYDLFDEVPTTFALVDRAPVPAGYVLGPGDEIRIQAWGLLDVDYTAVVDRGGQIYVPKVGALHVAGLRYEQLPGFLRSAFSRVFQNFELSVSMGQLRSLQVFVVGQARRPGAYTVSGLSTLVNALFASGGPSPTGSLRRVQLRRGGALVTEFDLYDLLVQGDKSRDVPLQSGDVLYIPPAGPQVALHGSVHTSAIFELKGPTRLEDVVAYAGGLSVVASAGQAFLERIQSNELLAVKELHLGEGGMEEPLAGGDIVRIQPITGRFENAVTLRGSVTTPGRFPWREGMRVRDLIPTLDVLIPREYWTRAGLSPLAPAELSLSDVRRISPEINWEYALVQRFSSRDLRAEVIGFNLGKALLENDPEHNLALRPGDVVTIFTHDDLSVAYESRSRYIRLEGEVRSPGVHKARAGETLPELVRRVGGLTDRAYLFGATFTRVSALRVQQERHELFVREYEREIERVGSRLASTAGSDRELLESREQIERQRRLLQSLRELRPTGRVVLEVGQDASTVNDLPDLELEDGDRFFVPHRLDVVHVVGAVNNEGTFMYRPESRLRHYLQLAGGGTREADRDRAFVIRANGAVVTGSSRFGPSVNRLRLMPGDTVVLPARPDVTTFMKGLRDWSQVISQFALGAAAVWVFTR